MKTKKPNYLIPVVSASVVVLVTIVALTTLPSDLISQLSPTKKKVETKWQLKSQTYQTTWDYSTPSGRNDKIGFTLTLEGDTITGVTVQPFTESKDSQIYQKNFGKEVLKIVVGKKLADVAGIDNLAGASGTTQNFKDAVAALKLQLGY